MPFNNRYHFSYQVSSRSKTSFFRCSERHNLNLTDTWSLFSKGWYLVYNWEALIRTCSAKKVFLKILQSLQENPVPEFLFNKVAGLRHSTLLKEALAKVFSCENCEILKNNSFIEHLWWLFLIIKVFMWKMLLLETCRNSSEKTVSR